MITHTNYSHNGYRLLEYKVAVGCLRLVYSSDGNVFLIYVTPRMA